MSLKEMTDQSVAKLVDANLDRAREGLRVIEEWCRFSLINKSIVISLKDWRQLLGIHHHRTYKEKNYGSQSISLEILIWSDI